MTRPTDPSDRPDRRVLLDLDGVVLDRSGPDVVVARVPYDDDADVTVALQLDLAEPLLVVEVFDREVAQLSTDEAVDLAYALLALVREADARLRARLTYDPTTDPP